MFDELYPIEVEASEDEKNYRLQRFQSENYLRLASKYEAAFGYARLDTLIRNMNPDDDHVPGVLHQKLLELPWNDIFTTNYDTLLERTEVLDRTYQTIESFSELPGSLSPRIFKLHGSFSNTDRLVIAEEHYRKYPKDSAPFVNTVQQSLLENSFVLIGFSGDDPNFLAWTGWIRDELQDRHSSIYLVGPLNLTNTDRLLLKRRGVTPIDLCPMFRRDEHYESILWFLESLANASPQRPENWLDSTAKRKFLSTKPLAIEVTKNSPFLPEIDSSLEMTAEQIFSLMNVWIHERLSYPGWVVAPESKRNKIWSGTRRWIGHLIKALPRLDRAEKIVCVQEIIWRLNLSMMPLNQDLIAVFDQDLVDMYEELKKNNFRSENFSSIVFGRIFGHQILSAWLEVSLEVLREAREVYDDLRWTKISSMIDNVLEATQIRSDRYIYEKLLQSAWNVKLDSDLTSLIDWQPHTAMPIAQLWKASLLTEAGKVQEAKTLLESALNDIRQSAKNKGDNIELLSLEGWCTYLIACVDMSINELRFESSDFGQRWQELKAWDCNPWEIRKELESPLNELGSYHVSDRRTNKVGFDPKVVSRAWNFNGGGIGAARPAFSYLRHFEHVGIPMYCSGVNIIGKHLEKALQIVQPYIGFWSPALMIRARQIKQITDSPIFLSRPQVASMDTDLARRINSWCLAIFENYTEKYYASRHQKILKNRLVSDLPEIVSRLSFKLSPEELDHSFQLALKIYSALANLSIPAINGVCHKWLTRIYETADDQQLMNWLPDLLKAPFREIEGSMSRNRHGWIDPMSNFPVQRISIKSRSKISLELKKSIAWLYGKTHSLTGEARSSAIWRLTKLNAASLLDKNEIKKLRDLLWQDVEKNSLPTDLHPFNYLHLPKRSERTFFELFKKHLLDEPFTSSLMEEDGRFILTSAHDFPSERFNNIIMSSKSPVQLINEMRGLVIWTGDEVVMLFDELFDWWETVKEASLRFDDVHSSGSRWFGDFVLRLVGTSQAELSKEFLSRVYSWVIELRGFNIYADSALSSLYFSVPNVQDEIEKLLLIDVNSSNDVRVKSAVKAIHNFYALAQTTGRAVSSKLLKQLVNCVAFRSTHGLPYSIEHLGFLIMQFPTAFEEDEIQLLCDSLAVWHEAVTLPVDEDYTGFDKMARPDLQAAVGTLAGAIFSWLSKNSGVLKQHPGVELWKGICNDSCLPEIKRAFLHGVQYSMKKNQ